MLSSVCVANEATAVPAIALVPKRDFHKQACSVSRRDRQANLLQLLMLY